MSRRRRLALSHEDPAVSAVEHLLSGAVPIAGGLSGAGTNDVAVADALWICACVTAGDSPTWLIYETLDGTLGWHRVPDGVEPADLFDARSTAGGHADPAEVLRWLSWGADDPWSTGGSGVGDRLVLDRLRSKINPLHDRRPPDERTLDP